MPKTRPKYRRPLGTWSTPAEFTKEQAAVLASVCSDQEFMASAADIVGDYHAHKKECEQMPTDAQELATLEDLQRSIADLDHKLAMGLNGRAGAYLYKVDGDISTARLALQKISIEAARAIQEHKPAPGRKHHHAKKEAARRFRALFIRHSIPWTFSIYACRKSGKTTYSNAVKILSTFLSITPQSAKSYIK